ncbi:B3 domain-containing protein At4g34400-like [Andrographis paniculata]|uniref:B3 domain-containing protein At4g34400-like n=1 Tax=Andrographis paniculata TaxID=175694 RepID=UPI0021E99220|nr:B3 domain-containing protein At4g34400-like [Andrographis paniculata]
MTTRVQPKRGFKGCFPFLSWMHTNLLVFDVLYCSSRGSNKTQFMPIKMKCPAFFTFYFKKINYSKVSIPNEFITQLDQPLPKAICLLGHYNMPWIASVQNDENKWCLVKGWSKFVKDMKIEEGDFLLFEYFIRGFFDVKVFDPSGMEKVIEKDSWETTYKDNKAADECDNKRNVRNSNNIDEEGDYYAKWDHYFYDDDEAARVHEQTMKDVFVTEDNVQVTEEGQEVIEVAKGHVLEDSVEMIEEDNEDDEEANEVNKESDEYEPNDDIEGTDESLHFDSIERTEEIHETIEDTHFQNMDDTDGEILERTVRTRDEQDSQRKSRDLLSLRYGIDIFRAGLAPQPQNPYFVTGIMNKRKGNLFVPNDLVKDNGDIDFSKKAYFIDPTGRRLVAKCTKWKNGTVAISGGWRKLCTLNYIEKDDRCICEIVDGEEELGIHVTVVRGNDIRG